MKSIGIFWIYMMVLGSGALQAWGPPMNGALKTAFINPWLASLISFIPIVAFLLILFFCQPMPLPSTGSLSQMPWWAPMGGLIGAFAVVAGLLFVQQLGAGTLSGLTITANILMSLAIDHFGWFQSTSGGLQAGFA
jgi:bacterial/archaeal transporter family-2 protein